MRRTGRSDGVQEVYTAGGSLYWISLFLVWRGACEWRPVLMEGREPDVLCKEMCCVSVSTEDKHEGFFLFLVFLFFLHWFLKPREVAQGRITRESLFDLCLKRFVPVLGTAGLKGPMLRHFYVINVFHFF